MIDRHSIKSVTRRSLAWLTLTFTLLSQRLCSIQTPDPRLGNPPWLLTPRGLSELIMAEQPCSHKTTLLQSQTATTPWLNRKVEEEEDRKLGSQTHVFLLLTQPNQEGYSLALLPSYFRHMFLSKRIHLQVVHYVCMYLQLGMLVQVQALSMLISSIAVTWN